MNAINTDNLAQNEYLMKSEMGNVVSGGERGMHYSLTPPTNGKGIGQRASIPGNRPTLESSIVEYLPNLLTRPKP